MGLRAKTPLTAGLGRKRHSQRVTGIRPLILGSGPSLVARPWLAVLECRDSK